MLSELVAIPKQVLVWVWGLIVPFFDKYVVSKLELLVPIVEYGLIPDFFIRLGIRIMIWGKIREETASTTEAAIAKKQAFIAELKSLPIAINTADANRQHYEVPAAFYNIVLGPWKKYSSCYWTPETTTLLQAEENMLKLVCERAKVSDGQTILDLGCGWASCSLWLATQYPKAKVVGVSNSNSQREHNEQSARDRGLTNVQFITADINSFEPPKQMKFDRIITNEMFEHMKNYEQLLGRVSSWLASDGLLFVHIFTHKSVAYHFKDGWMAENFFTGGQMPSDDLLLHFQRDVCLEQHWVVNGLHYQKTLDAWLARQDRNQSAVRKVLAATYGEHQTSKWNVYWRLFFLACSECFGYDNGNEYVVSHYLFSKRAAPATATGGGNSKKGKSAASNQDQKS